MPRWLGANVAVVLLVAACSAPNALRDDDASSQSPDASASPPPTASAVPTPTREPTSRPTPVPAADLAIVSEVVYAWTREFSDFTSYQVIVAIENVGPGLGEVSAFDSDYQVLDASGGLVATGGFVYAFPEVIGQGERSYLIADGFEPGLDPALFVTVEADGRYDEANDPGVMFAFDELQLVADQFGGGYTANGFVTADAEVTDAAIAVICLDANGVPIGATWTNLVQNLSPGERKGFETVGSAPPLDPSQCSQLVGIGQDTGF